MLNVWQSSLIRCDSHSQVRCRHLQDSQVATLHVAACIHSSRHTSLDAGYSKSSSLCCRYLRESLVAALRNPMETFQRRARFINYGELPEDHHSKSSCSLPLLMVAPLWPDDGVCVCL